MDRVTLRLPHQQVEEVEQLVERGEFPNRSEAIRAAVRDLVNDYDRGHDHDREREKRPWAQV